MVDKKQNKTENKNKNGNKKEEKDEIKKKIVKLEKQIPFPIVALQENLLLLDIAVQNSDQSVMKRVLRKHTYIRRYISLDDFEIVAKVWLSKDVLNSLKVYLNLLSEKSSKGSLTSSNSSSSIMMDLDEGEHQENNKTEEEKKEEANNRAKQLDLKREEIGTMKPKSICLTETRTYLQLYVANALLNKGLIKEAQDCINDLLNEVSNENTPTLGILLAKAYHISARCAELLGEMHEFRTVLLKAHRSACLQLNEFLQATLVNLILRSFCECNLIEQAAKFSSKAIFPEQVSNNQQIRYLFYMGRIHAIQLDYSLSYSELIQALRKSPTHKPSLGFRIAVVKMVAIVQLLMGDTPERSYFSDPELETPLLAYLALVKAVRNGSLAEYDHVCKTYADTFSKDKVSTLVIRLRNSVIRTGLRSINKSYSCISFTDVAKRLALDSPDSAELACAKAIRDGVIEATINHEKGHLLSKDVLDVYGTIEPQQAFHRRIEFCFSIHNDAVKSMRYPEDAHKAMFPNNPEDDDEVKKTDEEIVEEELEDDE